MKKIIEKWCDMSLVLRIFIGLVLGAILGVAIPKASIIAVLGTVFVGALKAIAPVLVAVLVTASGSIHLNSSSLFIATISAFARLVASK